MKRRDNLKQELLKHYATREPAPFYQMDTFLDSKGDCVINGDADGNGITARVTFELMQGPSVRVLVSPKTSEEDALRLLKKVRADIKKNGFAWFRECLGSQEAGLDSEICARCGAAVQAAHHALCQHRDGTPTALTDEGVRQALRELEWDGGAVDEERKPF